MRRLKTIQRRWTQQQLLTQRMLDKLLAKQAIRTQQESGPTSLINWHEDWIKEDFSPKLSDIITKENKKC